MTPIDLYLFILDGFVLFVCFAVIAYNAPWYKLITWLVMLLLAKISLPARNKLIWFTWFVAVNGEDIISACIFTVFIVGNFFMGKYSRDVTFEQAYDLACVRRRLYESESDNAVLKSKLDEHEFGDAKSTVEM